MFEEVPAVALHPRLRFGFQGLFALYAGDEDASLRPGVGCAVSKARSVLMCCWQRRLRCQQHRRRTANPIGKKKFMVGCYLTKINALTFYRW